MKAKLIEALAEVLDIDLQQYANMEQDALLALLEARQAIELGELATA